MTTTKWFAYDQTPKRAGIYDVMTWSKGDTPETERLLWDGGWKWTDGGDETLTPDMVWRGRPVGGSARGKNEKLS